MTSNEKFVLAKNLYRKNLGEHILLFNPDAVGNPVLLSHDAAVLLEKCRKGISLKQMAAQIPSQMSLKDRASILSFIRDYCLVQKKSKNNEHCGFSGLRHNTLGIWFHITNDCNLRCPYCFVNKSKESLTRAKIDHLVSSLLSGIRKSDFKKVKIKFSGGEPLLRVDLIKYTVNMFERGAKGEFKIGYAILSNGTMIDEKTIRFLKNYNIGIGISLDGYGDSHDKTRKDINGKGTFNIIENNINLLKANEITPFIMATISEETIQDLPRLTRWLLDNKLYARYSYVRYPNYSLKDYNRFCKKIIIAMNASKEEIKKHHFGPLFALRWKIADLSFTKPIVRQPCGIGKSHFIVNHLGELALCPMTMDNPIGTIEGDIFAQYDKYEKHYDQGKPANKNCQKCQWHKVCGTGCPILNEQFLGNPNARSPFCHAYRKLIPLHVDTYGWALHQLILDNERPETDKDDTWSKEV